MTPVDVDAYVAMVAAERPLLVGTATLLTGDPAHSERLVSFVLAQLYARWASVQRPRTEALASLVQVEGGEVPLPVESGQRFELVDQAVASSAAPGIMSDLRLLSRDQRLVIVLERFVELPSVQIAELLGRPVDEVLVLARQAQAALAAGHPDRRSDAVLAAELRAALPTQAAQEQPGWSDLAQGRTLVRRRRLRQAAAAVAALVVAVLAVSFLLPRGPVPSAGPPAATGSPASSGLTPGTSTSAPEHCDTSADACRSRILYRWRADMVEVARSQLGSAGDYFTGFGYTDGQRYVVPGFWSGAGGALGFEMFRVGGGRTQLYVQIATDARHALRCGETTGQQCFSTEFMDGNQFTLTKTSRAAEGVEVQYRLDDQVITIVARDSGTGRRLALQSSDLIRLAEDPRLRLPTR